MAEQQHHLAQHAARYRPTETDSIASSGSGGSKRSKNRRSSHAHVPPSGVQLPASGLHLASAGISTAAGSTQSKGSSCWSWLRWALIVTRLLQLGACALSAYACNAGMTMLEMIMSFSNSTTDMFSKMAAAQSQDQTMGQSMNRTMDRAMNHTMNNTMPSGVYGSGATSFGVVLTPGASSQLMAMIVVTIIATVLSALLDCLWLTLAAHPPLRQRASCMSACSYFRPYISDLVADTLTACFWGGIVISMAVSGSSMITGLIAAGLLAGLHLLTIMLTGVVTATRADPVAWGAAQGEMWVHTQVAARNTEKRYRIPGMA